MKKYALLLGCLLFLYSFSHAFDLNLYPTVNKHCSIKQNTIDLFCSDNQYEEAAEKIQSILGNRMRNQGSTDFEKKMSILEKKIRSLYSKPGLSEIRKMYLEIVLMYVVQYQDNTVNIGPLLDELFAKPGSTIYQTLPALLQVRIDGFFPRWGNNTKSGFGLRFFTRDVNENAINSVVQGTVPQGYCLEFIKNNLPLDFVYLRTQGGTRLSYHEWKKNYSVDASYEDNVTYCGVAEFKIVLPKKHNFFSDGFGVGFVVVSGEPSFPTCSNLVFSADNAAYEELSFCIQREVGPGVHGHVWNTFEYAIESNLIKLLQ